MPGTQIFHYANIGKETTRGTPVAPTRQLYVEGTGVLEPDLGIKYHEAENAGRRTRIRRATATTEDVNVNLAWADGVSYDDLVIPISQIKGGLTGTGAGADKTWTFVPSMTAANAPESYSLDTGDDVQNWRVQYLMARSWKIAAARGDLTSLELDCFGQRAIKGAKATPGTNAGVKIPGDLWTIKFASSIATLGAASIQTNFLLDFELEVFTGLRWRHYLDGNPYGGQHVETDISGSLNLTVESTALAVSEFYDKAAAQTLDFVRLKATGPSLGASNYSAQFDAPILWELPKPIGAEEEGINLWKIVGHIADDGTTGSIQGIVVNSLAALP
jgi:hypothetical protein